MLRFPVLAGLAGVAVLAAAAPAPAATLGGDVYDCPSVRTSGVVFQAVLAERGPLRRGAHAGTATRPSCRPGSSASRGVRVFRVGRVSPRLALLAEDDGPRTVLVRAGSLPQLPGHPLHRALFGSRRLPDSRPGGRCRPGRAVTGRVVAVAPGAPLRLRAGGRTVLVRVEAHTRVSGGARVAGQPVLRPRGRVSADVLRCLAGTTEEYLVARRLRL